jgi:hypothetical protein
MWRIGRALNSIPIYSCIQQDATSHSLFISGNCSTCFGWYFHPSSGAHTTASTASVICHTVTAICRYRGRVGTGLSVLWVAYATNSTLKHLMFVKGTVHVCPTLNKPHVHSFNNGGRRWCSWLRHCVISRKVAGLIPDGVRSLNLLEPSGRVQAYNRIVLPLPIPLLGQTVVQLVEALRYKPEGRGFDSRWCQEPQPPGTLRACPGLKCDFFTFLNSFNACHLPRINQIRNI